MKIQDCGPFTETVAKTRGLPGFGRRATCTRCGATWKPGFPAPVAETTGDGSCAPAPACAPEYDDYNPHAMVGGP
jgi:hypothetical protein